MRRHECKKQNKTARHRLCAGGAGLFGAARGCAGLRGVARGCAGFRGVARGRAGLRGFAWCCAGLCEVAHGSLGLRVSIKPGLPKRPIVRSGAAFDVFYVYASSCIGGRRLREHFCACAVYSTPAVVRSGVNHVAETRRGFALSATGNSEWVVSLLG